MLLEYLETGFPTQARLGQRDTRGNHNDCKASSNKVGLTLRNVRILEGHYHQNGWRLLWTRWRTGGQEDGTMVCCPSRPKFISQ